MGPIGVMRSTVGVLAVSFLLTVPGVARSQGSAGPGNVTTTSRSANVNLMATPTAVPPAAPAFGFEPTFPSAQEAAREQGFYPPDPVYGIYAPVFLKGTPSTVRTSARSGMRVGLSGWTAPRILNDDRESSGGPALGLTIEWGRPMPEESPAPVPAAPTGQR